MHEHSLKHLVYFQKYFLGADENHSVWGLGIEQQMQILLMQLKTTWWAHQRLHTSVGDLKRARLPFCSWLSAICSKTASMIVLWLIFLYRSGFCIDSHSWPRKRPCMEAKQADKLCTKKTWSLNPLLLRNSNVSCTTIIVPTNGSPKQLLSSLFCGAQPRT